MARQSGPKIRESFSIRAFGVSSYASGSVESCQSSGPARTDLKSDQAILTSSLRLDSASDVSSLNRDIPLNPGRVNLSTRSHALRLRVTVTVTVTVTMTGYADGHQGREDGSVLVTISSVTA